MVARLCALLAQTSWRHRGRVQLWANSPACGQRPTLPPFQRRCVAPLLATNVQFRSITASSIRLRKSMPRLAVAVDDEFLGGELAEEALVSCTEMGIRHFCEERRGACCDSGAVKAGLD